MVVPGKWPLLVVPKLTSMTFPIVTFFLSILRKVFDNRSRSKINTFCKLKVLA